MEHSPATHSQNESMSVLMDGEIQPLELQRLLKNMPENNELRQRWLRMHMASHLLQKKLGQVSLDTTLADRVSVALEKEEALASLNTPLAKQNQASSQPTKMPWWYALGGFAVAASITLVVVIGVQPPPASQPIVPATPATSGQERVIYEPNNHDNRFQSISIDTSGQEFFQGKIIHFTDNQNESLNTHQWDVSGMPIDFKLIQYGVREASSVKQDVLVYSNGVEELALYIEPLGERKIPEGRAFSGDNLVLGRTLKFEDGDHFVTLVGNVSIALANRVVDSISLKH